MKKRLPKFKNEDTERKFWATHDSTDYIDLARWQTRDTPEAEADLADDLVTPAETDARSPQATRQQARCAVSIIIEDVRGGSSQGGIGPGLRLPERSFVIDRPERGRRSRRTSVKRSPKPLSP